MHLPLMLRGLSVAAQHRTTWTVRLVFAAAAALALMGGLASSSLAIPIRGETGLGCIAAAGLLLVLAAGPLLASDALGEEQREGTLELLLLTPLSPTQIVLSKVLPLAFQGGLAILGTLPLLTLPITLGDTDLATTARVVLALAFLPSPITPLMLAFPVTYRLSNLGALLGLSGPAFYWSCILTLVLIQLVALRLAAARVASWPSRLANERLRTHRHQPILLTRDKHPMAALASRHLDSRHLFRIIQLMMLVLTLAVAASAGSDPAPTETVGIAMFLGFLLHIVVRVDWCLAATDWFRDVLLQPDPNRWHPSPGAPDPLDRLIHGVERLSGGARPEVIQARHSIPHGSRRGTNPVTRPLPPA